MRSILYVILLVLDLYIWLLIAAAVLSWLVAFNVVNTRNQFVAMVGDFLYRITEPVLRPIRNMLPSLGGIDVSPVVVILIIILIKDIIVRYIYPAVSDLQPRPWTVAPAGSPSLRLTPAAATIDGIEQRADGHARSVACAHATGDPTR